MALERRDHRVDIGPAGRNIFISRDKQLQSRQAKRIKVLMRLVMVLVGLVVAVGVGLFVALYMVPYFQAEISLDSSSSAQGGGLSSLSQVEMPTYDSMGLPVYDDDVALFVINQNNPQDASYVPNTVEAEHYIEEGYLISWREYTQWLGRTLNRRLEVLELGAGMEMRELQVIRWPLEKTVFFNNKAHMYRINETFPQISDEIQTKAEAVKENSVEFVEKL